MTISPRDTARTLWRTVPSGLRRSLLFKTTRLAAPAARTPGPPAAEPMVVVGPIASATGLGEGARLCMRALRAQGLDVRGFDVSPVMLGGDPAEPIDLGLPIQPGPGTVILHVNAPLAPLALLMLGRGLAKGKRIIGYFAWELPDLPADWIAALEHVHEIWVPSRFTAEAFRRHTDRPIHVVAHPVAAPGLPPRGVDGGEPFTILTPFNMASGFTRKNPMAAVEAFKLAFGQAPGGTADARLILKTHHVSAYPAGRDQLAAAIDGDPRVSMIDGTLGRAELDALIGRCDALMLLHRSEGFGLPLAEAMGRGLPVVATNWSGNTDFMNFGNSCPVSYCLIPARDPQGGYDYADQVWAEPSVENAALHLRRLAGDVQLRADLGRAAVQAIRLHCSIQGYATTLRSLLLSGAEV
ncbi:glycosyl transferase family 1 [Skermanella stibiiresistens SB22]|uniref:Glycosyl transferase family 1 n=1 Tax=Skermanella stibiiresistens SB22 TaxID=1385369 RepID=W9H526_9PROT|nr:glycosyltransferase family 4 protein [Skermanella stibiiresistens]EWY41340.1 glycosyl transferase family 1 [Skermanella stibiiresistens SB22]